MIKFLWRLLYLVSIVFAIPIMILSFFVFLFSGYDLAEEYAERVIYKILNKIK